MHPVFEGSSTPSEPVSQSSITASSGLPTPTSHICISCHLFNAAAYSPLATSPAEVKDGQESFYWKLM